MKLKLDENLPAEAPELLAAKGHGVHTVREESLTGATDSAVFAAATRESRMLVTQDLDFSDVRKYQPGSHPGIVLLRLREPSRRRIVERLRQVLEVQSIDDWAGSFVVVSDRKLRVKRP